MLALECVATANPNFDIQQQAIKSLRKIHQICLGLQILQVVASVFMVTLTFLLSTRTTVFPFQFYAAMLYCFVAVFAHVVVYHVLAAVGTNVRDAYATNPGSVHQWLVFATARMHRKFLPFIVAHGLALVAVVVLGFQRFGEQAPRPSAPGGIATGAAFALGVACLARSYFALRSNSRHLRSFVESGGFAEARIANV